MGGYMGVFALAGLLVVGCGSPSSGGATGSGGASSSSGSSGNGSGAPSGGGGGSSLGGISPTGGGGAAGGGGVGPINCGGDFGSPTVVLAPEPGVPLASPAVSPDTLELFYVRTSGADVGFRRSTRADVNSMFAAGVAVPELDAACAVGQTRTIGLSSDGLRAYVVCYDPDANPTGPGVLHVADRASVGASFELRASTTTVGPSAAISADELTLYTSSDVDAGGEPPRRYVRATRAAEFGGGEDIPGLGHVNLSAPDPSPDELELFGALASDIVVTTRATRDGDFGEPRIIQSHMDTTAVYGAPEISQDCRSLFFVKQTPEPMRYTGTILVLRR